MSYELINIAASATSAVKNVYEIIKDLIKRRKNNQPITSTNIRLLKESSDRAIALARLAGIHSLVTRARSYMGESLQQIEKYRNTAIGDICLESLRSEWDFYGIICECYLRMTGGVV